MSSTLLIVTWLGRARFIETFALSAVYLALVAFVWRDMGVHGSSRGDFSWAVFLLVIGWVWGGLGLWYYTTPSPLEVVSRALESIPAVSALFD